MQLCYFLNNAVRNEPILIIFVTLQYPEKISYQKVINLVIHFVHLVCKDHSDHRHPPYWDAEIS